MRPTCARVCCLEVVDMFGLCDASAISLLSSNMLTSPMLKVLLATIIVEIRGRSV